MGYSTKVIKRITLYIGDFTEELMLWNYGVGEDSWESLGLQGDQTKLKEINPEYSLEALMLKLMFWYFGQLMRRANSLEKTLNLGKIKAGGEGKNREQDDWMASPTWRTWVWASSRSWWMTGKPRVLQSMGSQRVKHDWATELNWTEGLHKS